MGGVTRRGGVCVVPSGLHNIVIRDEESGLGLLDGAVEWVGWVVCV